jgi:chitodextrinase
MVRTTACLLVIAAALSACSDPPAGVSLTPANASVAVSVRSAALAVRWRFKLDGDYSLHSPGVAADGTVYVSMENGKFYAIAPNGTLRWVIQTGFGGLVYGPVSVAADGTINVAGIVASPSGTGATGAIFAISPTGTVKWVFNQTNQFIIAGPNIGPDGNIYAVADITGIGLFSLTPQGQLRFKTGSFTEHGALGQSIVFGSGQLYFAFDMASTGSQPSLFAYDLGGAKRFQVSGAAQNAQPVVGPNGNVVIQSFPSSIGLSLSAYTPAGSLAWTFYEFPGNTEESPDVGPDNVAYTVRNLSTLFAFNANGTERWRYRDSGILFQPRVGPRNDLLFMGGRITYGAPGFFLTVGTDGTPLWRVNLPDEPGFAPYGQLVPFTRPVFSPDGNTAFAVTDVAGDGASPKPYSFLYAIDVSSGAGAPPNQNPVASFTYSCMARVPPPGFNCTLNGSTSSDPDGSVTAWSWTAPSKPTKSGVTTSYVYPTAGNYSVTLTVTDNNGGTNSKTQTIVVGTTPPPNQNPVANFTINCVPRVPNVGSDCTFNGSSSTDPDGTVVSYFWSTPGRPSKSGVIVVYPFPAGSTPTVTLTVSDNIGATNSKTVQITVP